MIVCSSQYSLELKTIPLKKNIAHNKSKIKYIKRDYLLLVTSCCKDLGSFSFPKDIKTFGASLVQDPRTIDRPCVPEIQYMVL